MALGDAEILSGVFFVDFGETVVFGSQTAIGNFDAPGKDAAFSGTSVSDQDYRLEVSVDAFSPMPSAKDSIAITTGIYAGNYKVRAVSPMDDGKVIEILLRSV